MKVFYQASGDDGNWPEDVSFYVGMYGEGIHDFVLSAAPVLDVSPGCVAAALDWSAADTHIMGWSTADEHNVGWPSAGAGCPRVPAILR